MVNIVFCFEKKKFTFDRDKWFYASCDCLIMYFFSYQVGDRSVPAIPRRHFLGNKTHGFSAHCYQYMKVSYRQ